MAWKQVGSAPNWKVVAPGDGATPVGPEPLWMIGEDGERMAVVQIQGTSGAKANVTSDGKLSVDAQVTATVADSKIKGSTDAGTTWLPVKVDTSGQLLVAVNGSVALTSSSYRYFRLLTAAQTGLVTGGVGNPTVVFNQFTGKTLLLFTGWNDQTVRKIYAADIDERLTLSNFRLLIDPVTYGVSSADGISVFYDDKNGQWVLATSKSGTTSFKLIYMDPNMQTVVGSESITIPFSLADSGVQLVPLATKRLLVTVVEYSKDLHLLSIPDYTVRPMGTITDHFMTRTMAAAADVHHAFIDDGRLVILYETWHWATGWTLRMALSPSINTGVDTRLGHWTMAHVLDPLLPMNDSSRVLNLGHPHYTTYLGKPLLLFCTFPFWNQGGTGSYAHEIWGTYLPDDWIRSHTNRSRLYVRILEGDPLLLIDTQGKENVKFFYIPATVTTPASVDLYETTPLATNNAAPNTQIKTSFSVPDTNPVKGVAHDLLPLVTFRKTNTTGELIAFFQ